MGSDLPRRLYARPVTARCAGLDRVTKAAGGTTPEALITYPVADLQGDVVEPGGIDWADFNGVHERRVNLEHGPYVGTAEVAYKSVPRLTAAGQPDESLGLIALPFGVTTFFRSVADARNHSALPRYDAAGRLVGQYTPDECFAHAVQTAPLVADGTLAGVSLEFRPDGGEGTAYKSLGPSELLRHRDAFHFFKTRALGYAAACELPVNRYAGYVRASDEVLAKAEKALRVCERADTLERVRKSLSPLARLLTHNPTNRTVVPVRRDPVSTTATRPGRTVKGMYDDAPAAGPADAPAEEAAPAGPDMKPTPAALFQIAQGLMDLCDQAEAMGEAGEHPKGLKLLAKHCAAARALAAKIQADAESVAADVSGDTMPDDYDTPADAPEVATDDETGAIESKAFTGRWRPARFVKAGAPYTAAHLRRAKAEVPVKPDPETEQYLAWALDKIEEQKRALRAAGVRAD